MLKHLQELLEANVITEETAHKIREYYRLKKAQNPNRLFIILGILGSLLIGLGIILIIAHNWEKLPRITKTVLAFFPLIVGQMLCGYTLLKKKNNKIWAESSTTFLFFAIGACIALISQIYHISGNLSMFLLTWTLLSIPLVYIMNSSFGSLLNIAWATYFLCESSYWSSNDNLAYAYWPLIGILAPHYIKLLKHYPESNFTRFHHWLLPISVIISLGSISTHQYHLMFGCYLALFAFFIQFNERYQPNVISYKIIGNLGTNIILIALSFKWYWEDLRRFHFEAIAPETICIILLAIITLYLLYQKYKSNKFEVFHFKDVVFTLFPFLIFIGFNLPYLSVLIVNLLILAIGISYIYQGYKTDHLGILNLGLITITALIFSRFFDSELSFLSRGVLFIAVGIGFFFTNYQMLKKRKNNGQS